MNNYYVYYTNNYYVYYKEPATNTIERLLVEAESEEQAYNYVAEEYQVSIISVELAN